MSIDLVTQQAVVPFDPQNIQHLQQLQMHQHQAHMQQQPPGSYPAPVGMHQQQANGNSPPGAGPNGHHNNNNKETPPKTPVSLLQEALSRRGITPSYELVQIEGAIHEPTFRYRVSFNDKDAMGAGKSKKEAKHAAARALIEKLADINPGVQPASMQQQAHIAAQIANAVVATDGDSDTADAGPSNGDGDQIAGNPIGVLQEQCMSRRWPPPTYETEMEVGLPHQRQFTIACVVLKLREIGQGKSKKIAKRLAAHKMWLRLLENPHEGSVTANQHIEELANGEEMRSITNRYADLKDANVPVLTNQNSFKVAQFHRAMKASSGPRIAHLQQTCLGDRQLNFVQLLHEIAVEHQFEVTYVDIDERTYSGQHQCFVQLSTMPVAVLAGHGATYQEAQMDAAHNSLEYLKVMTKM